MSLQSPARHINNLGDKPPVGTTNQEEKRRFRGKGKSRSPAPRQFWNGPDDSLRTEDLREALRARKTLEEPGTSGQPPAGVLWVRIFFFLRGWAALPGFPPTQGLPEILRSNGTDRSEADAPREEKDTTRPSPEPPPLGPLGSGPISRA
jgi:hypothetical protein